MTLAACEGDAGSRRVSRDAPPAAAVVAPTRRSVGLAEQLGELAGELEAASAGAPDRLLTAEAITDQLMDAPRTLDWLGTGYDVEARLRQLQAMADGLVARLRRGATLDEVRPEIGLLQASVADLEAQLGSPGGGPAPPSLDSLLAQDPLRDVGAASLRRVVGGADSASADGATGGGGRGGPLGRPVPTASDTTGDGR